jgi:hypothetical protein
MGIYPSDRPPANIDLVTHRYLPGEVMRDFAHEYRAISHAQIELLAARVSRSTDVSIEPPVMPCCSVRAAGPMTGRTISAR